MNSPEDLQRIVQTVVESSARIIVVFSSDVDLSPLVSLLLQHNVTNRTWIASEAWVTSALVLKPGVSAQTQAWVPGLILRPGNQASEPGLGTRHQPSEPTAAVLSPQASALLGGTLGFAVRRGSIPGLQRHLLDLDPYSDALTEEFWEAVRLLDPNGLGPLQTSHVSLVCPTDV